MVVYAAFRNLAEAATKPLWFDELLTQLLSREPGVSALWNALKTGVDGMPPGFYLIERVLGKAPINEQIAYRIPSIMALSVTLLCVYAFVKRRNGPLTALLCTSVVLMTPLYNQYAAEARPYSMLVACIALAMVCYQRAPSLPWMAGLFLSLLVAVSLHYYDILAVALFGLAELFLAYETRRFRAAVWGAVLLAAVPLAIFRPLMVAIKAAYDHFWSHPQLLDALKGYGEFFRVDTPWGFALGVLSAAAVLGALLQNGGAKSAGGEFELHPRHEDLLILSFIGYPVIVFVASKLLHGGFAPRYFLCGILGIAIALGYLTDWFEPRVKLVLLAVLAMAFATQEFSFWRIARENLHSAGASCEILAGTRRVRAPPGSYARDRRFRRVF